MYCGREFNLRGICRGNAGVLTCEPWRVFLDTIGNRSYGRLQERSVKTMQRFFFQIVPTLYGAVIDESGMGTRIAEEQELP